MRRRARILAGLLALFVVVPAWAAPGMSTSFVDVALEGVPLGRPILVKDSRGYGVRVTNLGRRPVMVSVDVLQPEANQLKAGASPIPDPDWIEVSPEMVTIEGHSTFTFELTLTVPAKRRYRRKTYQAMIWIRGVPIKGRGVLIGGGMLTRLQFTTTSR